MAGAAIRAKSTKKEMMPEAGDYRKLFVVGCPRSGTTWLQLLLSQHESVATAPETQIFAYYLVHFERQWRHEHEGPGSRLQGRAGLSRLLSEAEFEDLCRSSALQVLNRIRAARPTAQLVLEKSPKHALHADFIRRLFPDALFLNVIRDPRDVAASLIAASRSWGIGWAPPNAVQAARMWVEHIERARSVAAAGGYREVVYEHLRGDPVSELAGLLEWLGLEGGRDRCEAAVRACEFGRLQQRRDPEDLPLPGGSSPAGFFRKGEAGGWKTDLTTSEVRAIEHICGPLMAELGYELTQRPGRRRPLRVLLHDGVQRTRESIDWQLHRVLRRM